MDDSMNNIEATEEFSEQKSSEMGKKPVKKKVVAICLLVVLLLTSVVVAALAIRQSAQTATICFETHSGEKFTYRLNQEESDAVKKILLRKRRDYIGFTPRCFASYRTYVIIGNTKVYLSEDECNVAMECDADDQLNGYNNDGFHAFEVSAEDFEYIESLYGKHFESTPWR